MKKEVTLSSLYQKRNRLRKKLSESSNILHGSVVELKRPCTYKNCKKCQTGVRHPANYLSYTHESKTKLFYLSKHIKEEAIQWTHNYKNICNWIDKMSEINRKILKIKADQIKKETKKR